MFAFFVVVGLGLEGLFEAGEAGLEAGLKGWVVFETLEDCFNGREVIVVCCAAGGALGKLGIL